MTFFVQFSHRFLIAQLFSCSLKRDNDNNTYSVNDNHNYFLRKKEKNEKNNYMSI